MNKQKIAILADSCTDVPKSYVEKYGMYIVPLKIIYRDEEFEDGVTITAQEVYDRFSTEVPKTSLPSAEVISQKLAQIKADGFEKVIVVAISSGLSGTFNVMKLMASQQDLEAEVIDTKNIAIGSGFTAIYAAQLIEQGVEWEELKRRLAKVLENTRVFFCVSTLEYLQKGGRIGLVASILGTAINLKPIISCNAEGIYYTVAKVRGRKQSISKAMELAVKFCGDAKHYNLAVVHGDAAEEAEEVKAKMQTVMPHYKNMVEGQISPALVVHTGPGCIGIVVQKLEEDA